MHFFWSASLLTATVAATPIVVNTVNDVTYEGTTADGVEQFQNIHFAEDTSGANRFEPPVPYFPTPGTKVDASKPGAGCPQATRGAIPAMIDVPYQSEDCLTLRIARPEKFEGPLPVMVYIYGGGGILGEAYDDFFTPGGLIQQSVANENPVIYVAMNYRVGVFGFAASEVLREGKKENIGLRDQYLALEWVRDNIAHFGGDPSQVLLFGQSFGGISTGLHLTAYGGTRPALFSKAIMTSGSVSGDRSDRVAVKTTGQVADGLGCTTTQGLVDEAAIECLKKVPIDKIAAVNLDVATKATGGYGFAAYPPAVDGDFIPDQPDYLLADGRFLQDIPLIVTWVADDGSFSASSSISTEEEVVASFASAFPGFNDEIKQRILDLYPVEEFEAQAASIEPQVSPQFYRASRIQRDIDPACPMLTIGHAVYKRSGPSVYVAELNETRLTGYWHDWNAPLGVSHLSDVPYFFNEKLPGNADNGPEALALSAAYSGSFSTFAATGNPVAKGKTTFQDWPTAFSPGTDEFKALIIGGPYGTAPASSASTADKLDLDADDDILLSETEGSSRVAVTVEQGRQVVFEALFKTGSFASNAYDRVADRKNPPRGHRPSSKTPVRVSALENERLVERCKYIVSHRI